MLGKAEEEKEGGEGGGVTQLVLHTSITGYITKMVPPNSSVGS